MENRIINIDKWWKYQVKKEKKKFIVEELKRLGEFYIIAIFFIIPFIFSILKKSNLPTTPFKNSIVNNLSFAASNVIDSFNNPKTYWGLANGGFYLFILAIIMLVVFFILAIIDYIKIFKKGMKGGING